jgi:two-component system LytT family response regulator
MINAILVDDEATSLEALKIRIEKYCPNVVIKGTYSSASHAVNAIKEIKPDLVFLDVQMPEMSGFDVLQQASPINFEVIFVSAYDQYAIKAIKFSALDYLLKPVDVDELIHAVEKVTERLNNKSNAFQYQSVVNNIQLRSGKIERIAVPTLDGIDFFDTRNIIYCKAEGSYTTLMLRDNQREIVSKNLVDFENLLVESGFCRVHHSYLINLDHVQKYVKGEGGYVILTDNHRADISRRKKEEFLALLNRP